MLSRYLLSRLLDDVSTLAVGLLQQQFDRFGRVVSSCQISLSRPAPNESPIRYCLKNSDLCENRSDPKTKTRGTFLPPMHLTQSHGPLMSHPLHTLSQRQRDAPQTTRPSPTASKTGMELDGMGWDGMAVPMVTQLRTCYFIVATWK